MRISRKVAAAGVLLSLAFAAAAIAALVEDQKYSMSDKAYYLSAQDLMYIRPGLNFTIL